MTLDERMRRSGWWKGRIGEYFTREAGALVIVDRHGYGAVLLNPRLVIAATSRAGVPDLAQRAKAAARKLARRIGFERREARKGMR